MTIALCPWKPVEGLLYEKELLPVGPITKWVNGEKQFTSVDIKLSFLERVVAQFKKFKEIGVRVPLFKTHMEDPDNDRGTVEDVFIRNNMEGTPSLFSHIRFSNEEAAAKGKNVDVSVMCPPKFVDGKGNSYDFPLRHVALTSIPVVPGLEPFMPVVFSFDTPSGLIPAEEAQAESSETPEESLELANTELEDEADALAEADALILIADLLGVDLAAGNQAIVDAVKLALGGEQPPEDLEEPAALAASHESVEPIVLSAKIISELAEARKARLNTLVIERIISPAMAAKLAARHCDNRAITLDFGSDQAGNNAFDDALEMAREMAADKPITKAPRSIAVALSHDDDANLPATVRDAKRRAAAAAKHKA